MRGGNVAGCFNIGKNLNVDIVSSGGGGVFEFVELALLVAVNFGAFAVFGQNFLIGVDDEHAVYAIYNHPLIVLDDLACIV